ncbi:hypothetical protein FA048_11140 [Pedobacter polaris]|uniref:DUF4369 domain-containing protein n=1 Tax=Pedobacter polaris TaxID=2571273 RepID=A0A4U1CXA1_9SPHI|nr:hypothetical protein [Pedobacter polaris]TKC10718.1 hypothetical protein FA048_11140 [Pedobacter polaris]
MRTLLFVMLVCATTFVRAQIKLISGQYTTEDGYYTVTINYNQNSLTLIEPNLTSTYNRVEGNIFSYVHQRNNVDYRIEVINPSTIQTFKQGVANSRHTIKLTSTSNVASSEQFKTYYAMAERYKAKMLTDKKDAQLWSFCAAAAMARSTMNDEGFKNYATKVSSSIKLITINKAKCPCEDAIPTDIWNKAN